MLGNDQVLGPTVSEDSRSRNPSNHLLAGATLLAAMFVAVQAWYARSSFVEGEASRRIERKLDICFDNFDAAARLDSALRKAVPAMQAQEIWPPKIVIEDGKQLIEVKRVIVPLLDQLDSGLTKASVLGGLDKYRGYLAQQMQGLSKQLNDTKPMQIVENDEATLLMLNRLSEFVGAQYSVFTGCRLIAKGDA